MTALTCASIPYEPRVNYLAMQIPQWVVHGSSAARHGAGPWPRNSGSV